MKVYLVMWSVRDSGYEIKGASLSREKAQAQVDTLNEAARKAAIQSTEDWIAAHPITAHPASHVRREWSKVRQSTLNSVNRPEFNQHYVEPVEVNEE